MPPGLQGRLAFWQVPPELVTPVALGGTRGGHCGNPHVWNRRTREDYTPCLTRFSQTSLGTVE